jgi:hypothetical protein
MLRIVTSQRGEIVTISLHGRLAGDWVGLVERSWRSIAGSVPAAQVTTILSDVSFIDAAGERLLERMWRQGVQFVASGCMNRYVVEKIQGRRTS